MEADDIRRLRWYPGGRPATRFGLRTFITGDFEELQSGAASSSFTVQRPPRSKPRFFSSTKRMGDTPFAFMQSISCRMGHCRQRHEPRHWAWIRQEDIRTQSIRPRSSGVETVSTRRRNPTSCCRRGSKKPVVQNPALSVSQVAAGTLGGDREPANEECPDSETAPDLYILMPC